MLLLYLHQLSRLQQAAATLLNISRRQSSNKLRNRQRMTNCSLLTASEHNAERFLSAAPQVLIAPKGHSVLQAGPLQREQLYSLKFVCLNEGSTVQAAQAAMLRRHGIAWRRLQIDMVRPASRRAAGTILQLRCHVADAEESI